MQYFSSKRAILLGMALTFVASGAQMSYAQDATAPADAVPVPTTETPTEPAAVPAKPAVVKLNPVGEPPEGKGQIVFFRQSRLLGAAVSFSVREGNEGIVKLSNGTYAVHVTEPGVKEYNIAFEAVDTLRLEIEEGETYYVLQSIAMGGIGARPNMTPSSEEAFQEKKLKLTKKVATDRK